MKRPQEGMQDLFALNEMPEPELAKYVGTPSASTASSIHTSRSRCLFGRNSSVNSEPAAFRDYQQANLAA